MIKIGDFSKIARVSVRMLRHYDQLGLLKPIYVDDATGYRSYSIEQLQKLNRIIFLKEMGFSLNEIIGLVDDDITLEDMKYMLLKRQKNLENEIRLAHLNLGSVMEQLRVIETERQLPKYDIIVKNTESYHVATYRGIVPHIREMGIYCYTMYEKLYKELETLKITDIGSEITFYYNDEYCETDLDMGVGVMISAKFSEVIRKSNSILLPLQIKEQEKVASLVHNGSFKQIEFAVIELLKWVVQNKYEIDGEVREIHLSGPAHQNGLTVEGAVIELQVPIKSI